ncbi:hypothetical protein AAFC00_006920 [Neodothiora populina]
MRQTLSLIEPRRSERSPLIPHSTSTEGEGLEVILGSDGFTALETFVPLKSCIRQRPATKKHHKTAGVLKLVKGPCPDVDFTSPGTGQDDICHLTAPVADHVLNEPLPQETAQRTTRASPSNHTVLSDRIVYAQLSSIQAPRRTRSSQSLSDDSDFDGYEADLLRSFDGSPCRDVLLFNEDDVYELVPTPDQDCVSTTTSDSLSEHLSGDLDNKNDDMIDDGLADRLSICNV